MDLTPWSASGEQSAVDPWFWIGLAGVSVFALLLSFLIVRAMTRQRRYRISVFGEEQQQAVHRALVEAERGTVGEILPVVVERSDPHPAAEWLAALTFLIGGSALLGSLMPWDVPVVVLLAQLGFGAVGFALARALPDFKRLFVFESRATEVAEEQAFQEFYANRLHRTEAATGVLLFVSLFEHRVIILADEGIDSRVAENFWAEVDDAILDGIRRGALPDSLIEGIRRAGECLAREFPWKEGDRNEVPDRLIVRRE